jgi:hypothetical protein
MNATKDGSQVSYAIASPNDKVVALFDPSRPRRERMPVEPIRRCAVTPIFDPITMTILNCDRIAQNCESIALRSAPTPLFRPEKRRLGNLRAAVSEIEAWVPLETLLFGTNETHE